MKCYLAPLLLFVTTLAAAQQDSAANFKARHTTYERHSVTVTASVGFVDDYKNNYGVPTGFEKSNTSGFAPLYGTVEYGVTKTVSIAAIFGYDAFQYNFEQEFTGNNGTFTRYGSNNTRIISGGLVAFYHLGNIIPVKNLDPFAGIGFSINNIRYGALPQGDSTVVSINHTVTPYLKAGARYYLSSAFSLFGDVGYDQHTIFSVGVSCRFFRKNKMTK